MAWLNEALSEVGKILQRQAVLVGPMADELENERLDRELEQLMSALVHRIAADPGVEAVLACKGPSLIASDGPLINYVALSEATHGGRWAMEKVAKTFQLGKINQTVVIGEEKKLAMLSVGEVTISILAPLGVSIGAALK